MDLSCRHPGEKRRRRRHRRGAAVADGARNVLATSRQPLQQRARLEGLRGVVVALRPPHAQPQRRSAHLHHRRLRHSWHRLAPQPPAARAADPRRAPQRHPRDRIGRRFAAIDYVTRKLASEPPNAPLLILDFRRVPDLTAAGAQLLGEKLTILGNTGVTAVLTGFETISPVWTATRARVTDPGRLRSFVLLDDAIEWAEDQVIYRFGGFTAQKETTHLGEQALLADLEPDEIAALAGLSTPRRYEAGQRIVSTGEPANSLFFLQSGMVSVKLPSGVRLASLGPGMEFGEMAILEHQRSADVWADTQVKCLELPLDSFADYRRLHPQIALQIMRNLSALLARPIILANAKVDLLSTYRVRRKQRLRLSGRLGKRSLFRCALREAP